MGNVRARSKYVPLNWHLTSTEVAELLVDSAAQLLIVDEGLESVGEDATVRRPVQVVFTRGEEIGLVGASNLDYSMIRASEAVVFDGNGPVNTITGASPTYMRFDITVKGRAAHAGVDRRLRADVLRLRRHHVRAGRGRARPRVRQEVRPARARRAWTR